MKKLLFISLSLLVVFGLYAKISQADKELVDPRIEYSPNFSFHGSSPASDETWDVLNTFDCSAASHPGIETDGTNIYTTAWNAGTFSRYEMDGTLLGDFTIAGVSNIRDMAYDGTYFYGSPASMTISIMDLANETLIGTIGASCGGVTGVRHIAFDPDLDGGNGGFWIGNWNELGAITMSGAQIYANLTPAPQSLYGSAHDPWTPGGPYLWVFSQDGSGAELHQFDIASQSFTGVMHDASDIPGAAVPPMAGGLATYVNDSGLFVMLTNLQQTPNLVGVYEIFITADPLAPGAPTAVTVTPDDGGLLEAQIDWICPALDVGGNALTDLDEMRVFRDGVLIHTDSNPTIGAAGSYFDDAVPAAGNTSYSVVGINDMGDGIPAGASAWVGEDVPDTITNLTLTDMSTDDLIAQLDWVNPTAGLNGGYFNGVTGYDIVRLNDGTAFVVTGATTQWQDTSITDPGVYSYSVTPYNGSGSGPATVTPQVGIGVSLVQVGNQEVGDYQVPINLFYMDSMVEVVYLQEWIGSDMLINTISFHANTTTTLPGPFSFELWMGETDETDLSAGWIAGTELTQVFGGTLDVPAGDSWIDITLDDAFAYEYSGNLVLMMIRDDSQYYSTSDLWWCTESGTSFRTRHAYTDNSTGAQFNAITGPFTSTLEKSIYPDVRFTYSELAHGSVDGVVTNSATSNPVDGAEVYIGSWGPAVTSATGGYLLEDMVAGIHDVVATKDGYYIFEGSVEVIADQTVTYDFAMDPNLMGTLEGTVTDADTGDPLVGADINAISTGGYEYDVVTDDTGYYVVNDIVAETYDITCHFPDYPPGLEEDVVIADGATVTIDFDLMGFTLYSDFEVNNGGFVGNSPWEWGGFTSGPMAGHSGSNGWATMIGGAYPNQSNGTVDTPGSYMIGETNAMLEFWHWYNIENSWDGGNVKISTDGGSNWSVIVPLTGYTGTANTANPLNGEEVFCGVHESWELVQFELGSYVGQSVMFRWHFGSDGSVTNPGWYIDDVSLSGGGPPPEPGFIAGTVDLDGGTGDVQNVLVTAGDETTNPAADGTYTIEIAPGTYDVTAELAGYETATYEDVEVEGGVTTDDIDLTLEFIVITFDAPTNLAVDAETALFTWEAPGGGTGDMFELIQHSNEPENALYQSFDFGYGVVYDLSGFNNVTIEQLDFRHSPWGFFGNWDYSIHIVDWDTYTELAVVEGLQTTGDDQWEEGIDLGSVSESGLVGIFIEALGNVATDAYPCIDGDNVLDGTSYYGDLSDYSAMAASGVGDFLIDLWIMGSETRELVKAKRFKVTQNTENTRKRTQLVDFVTTEQTVLTRNFTGCNVYLDNDLLGFTSNTEWQFEIASLIGGDTYEAGLIAVYSNPNGESDYVSIDFEYDPPSNAGNDLVIVTELAGNYPNPFNPETKIAYSIEEAGNVSLEIYNMKGQLVRTLVNEVKERGTFEVIWNGTDDDNRSVSSGIYFYKMKAGDRYTSTKKMILLK